MEPTFQLICKKNPTVSNAANIDEIDYISLNECNLDQVSNLELFSHISRLSLAKNNIQYIDNLKFFNNLRELDLSFNKITSEGLYKSLSQLPSRLETLVLSGNPCCSDYAALEKLQDEFPSLAIAIADQDEGGNEDPVDNSTNNAEGEEDSEDDLGSEDKSSLLSSQPLDAEKILKEIVDRKCRIQNMRTFNLDDTVAVLNEEMSKSINYSNSKRLGRAENRLPVSERTGDFSRSLGERTSTIVANNITEKTAFEDVLNRMKDSASKQLAELKAASMTRRAALKEEYKAASKSMKEA